MSITQVQWRTLNTSSQPSSVRFLMRWNYLSYVLCVSLAVCSVSTVDSPGPVMKCRKLLRDDIIRVTESYGVQLRKKNNNNAPSPSDPLTAEDFAREIGASHDKFFARFPGKAQIPEFMPCSDFVCEPAVLILRKLQGKQTGEDGDLQELKLVSATLTLVVKASRIDQCSSAMSGVSLVNLNDINDVVPSHREEIWQDRTLAGLTIGIQRLEELEQNGCNVKFSPNFEVTFTTESGWRYVACQLVSSVSGDLRLGEYTRNLLIGLQTTTKDDPVLVKLVNDASNSDFIDDIIERARDALVNRCSLFRVLGAGLIAHPSECQLVECSASIELYSMNFTSARETELADQLRFLLNELYSASHRECDATLLLNVKSIRNAILSHQPSADVLGELRVRALALTAHRPAVQLTMLEATNTPDRDAACRVALHGHMLRIFNEYPMEPELNKTWTNDVGSESVPGRWFSPCSVFVCEPIVALLEHLVPGNVGTQIDQLDLTLLDAIVRLVVKTIGVYECSSALSRIPMGMPKESELILARREGHSWQQLVLFNMKKAYQKLDNLLDACVFVFQGGLIPVVYAPESGWRYEACKVVGRGAESLGSEDEDDEVFLVAELMKSLLIALNPRTEKDDPVLVELAQDASYAVTEERLNSGADLPHRFVHRIHEALYEFCSQWKFLDARPLTVPSECRAEVCMASIQVFSKSYDKREEVDHATRLVARLNEFYSPGRYGCDSELVSRLQSFRASVVSGTVLDPESTFVVPSTETPLDLNTRVVELIEYADALTVDSQFSVVDTPDRVACRVKLRDHIKRVRVEYCVDRRCETNHSNLLGSFLRLGRDGRISPGDRSLGIALKYIEYLERFGGKSRVPEFFPCADSICEPMVALLDKLHNDQMGEFRPSEQQLVDDALEFVNKTLYWDQCGSQVSAVLSNLQTDLSVVSTNPGGNTWNGRAIASLALARDILDNTLSVCVAATPGLRFGMYTPASGWRYTACRVTRVGRIAPKGKRSFGRAFREDRAILLRGKMANLLDGLRTTASDDPVLDRLASDALEALSGDESHNRDLHNEIAKRAQDALLQKCSIWGLDTGASIMNPTDCQLLVCSMYFEMSAVDSFQFDYENRDANVVKHDLKWQYLNRDHRECHSGLQSELRKTRDALIADLLQSNSYVISNLKLRLQKALSVPI